MTSVDITIFQVLALGFVLSFIFLTYQLGRFVKGIETRHNQNKVDASLNPILADLQAGAVQFRLAGERAKHGSEALTDTHGPLHTTDGFQRKGREGGLGSTGPAHYN